MRELTQKPILKVSNVRKQFVLRTDASDGGFGAVLLQEHDGMNMPVTYASRKLSGQLNWATINGYTFIYTVRNSYYRHIISL